MLSLRSPSPAIALLIHSSPFATNLSLQFRFFSQAAVFELSSSSPSLTTGQLNQLEGFPSPDPKSAETILGIPHVVSGTSISVKERKVGLGTVSLFSSRNMSSMEATRGSFPCRQQIRLENWSRNWVNPSFSPGCLFLEVRSEFGSGDLIEKVRVLPRTLHLHASTDAPLNVTFVRAPSHALLKVDIPLVFQGEDVSPGLKKGASLNTIKRTVRYLCPAHIIPPHIEVDLSELDVGQKLVIGEHKVHPALKFCQSKDEPVYKIMGGRVSDQQRKSK